MMSHTPDVIIVGGGIIGCAIGWELARHGVRVHLVDHRDVGLGATQASAGVLAPYIEGWSNRPLLDLGTRSLAMYDAFISRLSDDTGLSVEYQRHGTIQVATLDDSAERLKAAASVLAQAGVSSRFVDGTGARTLEPQLAEDVTGALLIADHGFVVVARLIEALVAAMMRRGATITPHTRVKRIRRSGATLLVETDRDMLSAADVVLAAGSWCSQIDVVGEPPLPVQPVRGQLLQLACDTPLFERVVWGERCYVVPWGDGSLLVGATEERAGFDERATVAGVRDLLEAVCDLAPRAWRASVSAVRVGLRPATPDELPIIGRSTRVPGLVYASGHYRNGVLLAPLTAALVGALVLDGQTDPALTVTDRARFGA